MLAALIPFVALLAAPVQDPAPQYDMKVRQLVFLRTPPGQEKERETTPEQMSAHLKFLEGLWEKRQALLVGPLAEADPWKGLVLLDVATKEEAEILMKEEPLISAGLLTMEIKPWFLARNVPQKGPKFLDIEPMWFGTLTRVKDAPKVSDAEMQENQKGHMANIIKMAEEGALVLAGPMEEDTDFRGIFIFRDMPKEKVEELAAVDPTIAKKRLELKLYRWYTSKGTFPEKKK